MSFIVIVFNGCLISLTKKEKDNYVTFEVCRTKNTKGS